MSEEKKLIKQPHNLILENRKTLILSGVTNVESFDEQLIILNTDIGELAVKGSGLHISRLSIDTGEVNVDGHIEQLIYSESYAQKEGFFSKLLR